MNPHANRIRHAIRPLIWLVLLAGLLALPAVSLAQQATETPTATATLEPTPAGPLAITAIQPDTLINDVAVELVVTGRGFVNGSVVVINNFGGLETVFVSGSVLRATVPPGLSPGRYTVKVVNPDAATAELPEALKIVLPAGPTNTPEASPTPAPTDFVRPLLVVASYGASAPKITPGQNLDFEMTLANAGQAMATNVVATFTSGDFVPRETGGVRALGTLGPGQTARFWQPLFATADLRGSATAVLKVVATYTDVNGQSYESAFELSFPVVPSGGGGAAATATPTATPTGTPGPRQRPQLVVTTNNTDPAQLQPGSRFALNLTVDNLGQANARNVTLILGGGSGGSSTVDGTPEPGGLAGAGGSFTEFAPIGSSNVSPLGDLPVGDARDASLQLIVNTTTKPGAYPVKVSFVYTDDKGVSYVDDQVITLLVFQTPQVQMDFYTQPPPFFAGQPGGLPLQLVNTGRNSVIFGNFSVTAEEAELTNNAIFVGALEPGGFFPLDALITPLEAGPLELLLSVNYTDDFSRPAVITQTLTIEVMEDVPFEPVDPGLEGEGIDGGGEFPVEENSGGDQSLLDRLWRFLRGLFGLGSESGGGGDQPSEEFVPVEPGFEVEPPPG
ncbi:MAG: IPT/TIG domain-containing protein [Candidatus Promineofilum sp.]|nr:IPT/TIG domain-containing protein [Promineifilum sp.]